MNEAAWAVALGFWALWWIWFGLSELWLRSRHLPVSVGVTSLQAWLLFAMGASWGALALAFDDTIAFWLFVLNVALPYFLTSVELVRLQLSRRSDS